MEKGGTGQTRTKTRGSGPDRGITPDGRVAGGLRAGNCEESAAQHLPEVDGSVRPGAAAENLHVGAIKEGPRGYTCPRTL